MTRQQRIDITNRLDTYLGYSAEESYAILREISHALGFAYDEDIIIQSPAELEQSEERAYLLGVSDGHRAGYMQATDDIVTDTLILAGDGDVAFIRSEIDRLRADYLDRY